MRGCCGARRAIFWRTPAATAAAARSRPRSRGPPPAPRRAKRVGSPRARREAIALRGPARILAALRIAAAVRSLALRIPAAGSRLAAALRLLALLTLSAAPAAALLGLGAGGVIGAA